MRIQLAEKGETIVGDLGMGAKLLVKNSDLHDVRKPFYFTTEL
jgi:hypothetical protein